MFLSNSKKNYLRNIPNPILSEAGITACFYLELRRIFSEIFPPRPYRIRSRDHSMFLSRTKKGFLRNIPHPNRIRSRDQSMFLSKTKKSYLRNIPNSILSEAGITALFLSRTKKGFLRNIPHPNRIRSRDHSMLLSRTKKSYLRNIPNPILSEAGITACFYLELRRIFSEIFPPRPYLIRSRDHSMFLSRTKKGFLRNIPHPNRIRSRDQSMFLSKTKKSYLRNIPNPILSEAGITALFLSRTKKGFLRNIPHPNLILSEAGITACFYLELRKIISETSQPYLIRSRDHRMFLCRTKKGFLRNIPHPDLILSEAGITACFYLELRRVFSEIFPTQTVSEAGITACFYVELRRVFSEIFPTQTLSYQKQGSQHVSI